VLHDVVGGAIALSEAGGLGVEGTGALAGLGGGRAFTEVAGVCFVLVADPFRGAASREDLVFVGGGLAFRHAFVIRSGSWRVGLVISALTVLTPDLLLAEGISGVHRGQELVLAVVDLGILALASLADLELLAHAIGDLNLLAHTIGDLELLAHAIGDLGRGVGLADGDWFAHPVVALADGDWLVLPVFRGGRSPGLEVGVALAAGVAVPLRVLERARRAGKARAGADLAEASAMLVRWANAV
jgi:hypothetical protein